MSELTVTWPNGERSTHPLDQQAALIVGRASWSSLELPDMSISREHARVVYRGGGFWIEDLGSQNGTMINDEPIAATKLLVSGDRIDLGPYRLVYTGASSETAIKLNDNAVAVATFASAEDAKTQATFDVASPEAGSADELYLFAKLNSVGRKLIGSCPVAAIYKVIVDLVAEVLAADRVHLVLQDEQTGNLVSRANSGPGAESGETLMSQSIARQVLDQQKAILIDDAPGDERFAGQPSVIKLLIQSAVCAPLRRDREVLGLIYADRTLGRDSFGVVDLHLMTVIGHLAAVKIRETEAEEKLQQRRQLEEELRNAAKIQQMLLPGDSFAWANLEIAGRFVPCHGVSGDFYDVLPDQTGTTLLLGDVAGKGMAAALLMAGLHARIHAYVDTAIPLNDLVTRLNAYLLDSVQGEKTATLFCARLDHETGILDFVNAGHNAPLLRRADGSMLELKTDGMLLGCLPEAAYESGTIEMRPGDVLAIFSDGVTEAETEAEEEFGARRLRALLADHAHSTVAEIADDVVECVQRFSEPKPPRDDLTVLVAKRLADDQSKTTSDSVA